MTDVCRKVAKVNDRSLNTEVILYVVVIWKLRRDQTLLGPRWHHMIRFGIVLA